MVFFHTKSFKVQIRVLQYFWDEQRIVLATESGALREMGVPVNADYESWLRLAREVLFVLLDKDRGKPIEDYYVPFKA